MTLLIGYRLVIEDIDVEPQLRAVKDHLDDVVLKKLSLDYLSGLSSSAFLPKSLTKSNFKVFHQVQISRETLASTLKGPDFDFRP